MRCQKNYVTMPRRLACPAFRQRALPSSADAWRRAATSQSWLQQLSGRGAQKTLEFPPDHLVALAGALLEPGSVEHRDAPAVVIDQSAALQFSGRLGDAFTPHAEHVRDELLRHG